MPPQLFWLLCLAWNPNFHSHGMVRLPKLSASKTGSLLCTYPVVSLRNGLVKKWVCGEETVMEKGAFFCLPFALLGTAALLSYLFLVAFSFDVV